MSFRSGRGWLWTVVVAKAVSFFGDQVAALALLLRVQGGGGGAYAVAGVLGADLLPIVLLAPVAGRLVDRFGSRGLLAVSGSLQAAVCTGLVFADGMPAILGLVALLGAGQAVNGATWQALLPGLVPAGQLPGAVGLSQAATTVGLVAAPATSGLLTGMVGARSAIALDAVTFGAVIAAGLLVPSRRAGTRPGRMAGGWSIVRRDATVTAALSVLSVFVLLGSMVNVVDVFFVRQTLGAGAVWYGLSGAAYALGLFGGSLVGGRRLARPQALTRAFLASAAMLGVSLAGIGLVPSVSVLLPVSVAAGACNGVLSLASTALIMGRVGAAERGRVAAVVGGTASAAQLVAYVAGGTLATVLDPRTIFVSAGLLGALTPVVLGRRLLRVRPPSSRPLADALA